MPFNRAQVVDEARTWLGTPYHLRGMLKGVVVDCGMLPYCVLNKFQLVPTIEYPPDMPDGWWAGGTDKRSMDERYLLYIERYLRRVLHGGRAYIGSPLEQALPGNLVLGRVCDAKVYNHAGIITRWPLVIHAAPPRVDEVNIASCELWSGCEITIFDIGLPA